MTKQDHQTPPDLVFAVEARFGLVTVDLAAHSGNVVKERCVDWYGPDHAVEARRDSLAQPWRELAGTLWLNPEFENIKPWAEKAERECRHRRDFLTMLVPAAVDSNWYRDHVLDKAFTLWLAPRVRFVGEAAGYPKPMMLVVYGFGLRGSDYWRWRGDYRKRGSRKKRPAEE